MIGLVLVLALGGVDSLSKQTLQGLVFKGPTSWEKQEGDANTLSWKTTDGEAEMAVSVYEWDKARPTAGCLKPMLEALGSEGFTVTTMATNPAAKKVTTDYLGEEGAEKTDANKVTTTTVIGCSGKIRWVLTWSAKTSEGARFGPILKRVLESISYGK
ncbi:MAG TPA: hypothetical protein VGD87_10965 [Archangium sp.]